MIEIKDITLKKLNFNIDELKPGDVIRICMPDFTYDYDTCRQVFEHIRQLLPDNVILLYLPKDVELKK